MPPILSKNINVNDFTDLLNYKNFINKLFPNNICLFRYKYILIGMVVQLCDNHLISYFLNCNKKYSEKLSQWYKYDGFDGYFTKVYNINFAFNGIKQSEGISLFFYLKL